ncbi:MAG: YceI family protein [Flavobacteriales bacterium]|nr:YceI family protein [Flavobacteriales bacterium]
MKKIILSFLIISTFACTNNTDNHDRSEVDYSSYGDSLSLSDLKINNELSNIKWIGSKVTESHYGTINIDKGVLKINDDGELVGGEFVIDMNSLLCTDIENEKYKKKLEDHLKDEDFFDVSNFPNSGIKITDVDKVEAESYRITADLTIKDITHSINFDADVKKQELNYEVKSNIKIDRTKWDVQYNSGNFFENLGDKLILDEIEFDVYLISQE